MLLSLFYDVLILKILLAGEWLPLPRLAISCRQQKLSSQEHIFHTQNNPESVASNTSLSDSHVEACISSVSSWGQLQIARDHPIGPDPAIIIQTSQF